MTGNLIIIHITTRIYPVVIYIKRFITIVLKIQKLCYLIHIRQICPKLNVASNLIICWLKVNVFY